MRLHHLRLLAVVSSLMWVGCSKKPEVAKTDGVEATPTSNQTAAPEAANPDAAPAPTDAPAAAKEETPKEEAPKVAAYGGGGSSYSGSNYGGASGPGSGYGSSNGGSSYGSNYGGSTGGGYGESSGSNSYGSSYGGGGGYGGGAAEAKIADPLTFTAAAEKAYELGNEELAARIAKAGAILGEESAKTVESTKWSTVNKQPSLANRIAVALQVTAPEQLTEYNPIVVEGASTSGYGGGQMTGYGASYGGGSGYGDAGTTRRNSTATVQTKQVNYPSNTSTKFHTELEKAAGVMATELIEYMVAKHEEGVTTPLFKEVKVEVKQPDLGGGAGAGAGSSYGGGYGGSYGGSSYGGGYGGGGYGGGTAEIKPNEEDPLPKLIGEEKNEKRLAAGLHYIGTGKTAELLKKAKAEGYSALVVYEVVVKHNNKINYTMNECRAKMYSMVTGKPVATSKSLENRDVAEAVADGKDTIVKDAMKPILAKLDEEALLSDMPEAITAELVKSKRYPALLAEEGTNKLDRIYELMMWKDKGMLDAADYQAGCEKLLGAGGTTLVTGTDEEKKEIVVRLLK